MIIDKIKTNILHYAGINTFARLLLKHKLYVLNYHSVSSAETDNEYDAHLYKNLSIRKEQFEKHIKFLKNKGHTFINLSDLSKLNLKEINKPTIIYFDDGFKDILRNALSVFQKYGVRATVFVSTDIVDGKTVLWTIKHRAYLKTIGIKKEKWNDIIKELKIMSTKEREQKIKSEYENSGFVWDYKNNNIFLDWEDIKILLQNKVEIGSHGKLHPNLSELDKSLVETEIKESKKTLEEKLGIKVDSFSYPYGRWNNSVNQIIKDAGYKAVVSNGQGLNNLDNTQNSFRVLKTVPVRINDSVLELESKLYARYFLRQ